MTYNDASRTAFTDATVNDSLTPGEIDFLINSAFTDYIYLRAHVEMLTGSLETIYTEEVQLYIEVTDPCLQAGIISANSISAIEYWIGDGLQA